MSAPDLAALRELLDAATPGPWEWRPKMRDSEVRDLVHIHDPRLHPTNVLKTTEDWPPTEADAALIAAAVTALPALLDRVERAEAAVKRVRTDLAVLADDLRKADPHHFSIGLMRGRVKSLRAALDGTERGENV